MTVFATQGQYTMFSSLVKANDTPSKFEFHTDLITANEAGTPTYTLGTVVGKVTATGKWKASVQTAVDGSQVPAGLILYNSFGEVKDATLVAATDTKFVALTRGKVVVALEAMKLDATYNDATKKQAAYDALKAVGILVESSN